MKSILGKHGGPEWAPPRVRKRHLRLSRECRFRRCWGTEQSAHASGEKWGLREGGLFLVTCFWSAWLLPGQTSCPLHLCDPLLLFLLAFSTFLFYSNLSRSASRVILFLSVIGPSDQITKHRVWQSNQGNQAQISVCLPETNEAGSGTGLHQGTACHR